VNHRLRAKPTIFGGRVDEDLVPQEPLDIPGRRFPTQPLVEPVEMVTSATPSTIKRAPQPSHRSFTAKTAKHAKNIANAIALLTHRIITTIFRRDTIG
jgi:hypothetical protein